MPDLLIELFSEEIPARMQRKAAEDLKRLVTGGLVDAGLTYAGARAFSTPRRLALTVQGLTAESPTTREERKGPRADAPAQAIEGFLRSTGLTREQLEERADKKGAVLFAVIEKPGRKAPEIVAEVLEATIRNFPWPKSMRWGAGSLRWVRPLHSILCLLSDEAGAEVVPLTVDGIAAGNVTRGHRFLTPEPFAVSGFEDYAAKLKRARVILDAEERAEAIRAEAESQAFAQGLEVVSDPGLLEEVSGLVEWPVVLMGKIDAQFLDLPPEVLQTSMKEHQKFFSVKDKTGRITRFVTVANTETEDHGATILAGNQKVLAARLSDAKFFWENDLRVAKAGMTPWLESLANVTFHNELGSQAERIDRIAALAREIAPLVGADPDAAEEAARLAKADLSSEMVYEFPELQGLMGRYYIAAAGKPAGIAAVAQEHYSPLGPSDTVPSAALSVAVALADKLDTLTGFWAIDEKPTGSKDPFALRRAALGVIRLLVENGVRASFLQTTLKHIVGPIMQATTLRKTFEEYLKDIEAAERIGLDVEDLDNLRDAASQGALTSNVDLQTEYPEFVSAVAKAVGDEDGRHTASMAHYSLDLLSFFHDRLKVFLKDRGIRHDIIDACLAMEGNDDLALLVKRAEALNATLATDDGANLIQGYKRAANILSQAEEKDGVEYSFGADPKFFEDASETALHAALAEAETVIAPALKAEDFATAMAAMAALRAPVDAFFEAVQVNAENQIVRRNRLNLLSRIRTLCGQVADLGRIEA
jgi:glycyl-tRNA synthetase beta chain